MPPPFELAVLPVIFISVSVKVVLNLSIPPPVVLFPPVRVIPLRLICVVKVPLTLKTRLALFPLIITPPTPLMVRALLINNSPFVRRIVRVIINKPGSNVTVSPAAAEAIAPRKLQSFGAAAMQAVKAASSEVVSTIRVAADELAAPKIKKAQVSKNV